ncbi:MAG TPA: hypothetical protein VJ672_00080 [Gemmatimonadaceae bacterium]|nr:hypothetical protein [Gemmatimonadaceae bacterium]
MPHLKRNLHVAARRVAITAALLCIGGCSGDAGDSSSATGEIIVLLSPARVDGGSIIASPTDPALADTASSHDGAAAPTVPSDSAALYRTLTDSASRLDAAFQRERTTLNREAVAMRSLQRTSADYHSRYQAFDRRAAAAESLRTARDRARVRVAVLERRYPSLREKPTASPPAIVRAKADADTVRLSLPPGDWWLSLSSSPRNASRVTVRAGTRDTIRIR